MGIKVLPLFELWALSDERVIFCENYTELHFDVEWQSVRDALRKKLQIKWKESCYGDADFALSDDRTNNWMQAGGIQNKKMLSWDLLEITFAVLNASQHAAKWGVLYSVNFNVGLLVNRAITGQILLKNNALYVAEYKDYDHNYILKCFRVSRPNKLAPRAA